MNRITIRIPYGENDIDKALADLEEIYAWLCYSAAAKEQDLSALDTAINVLVEAKNQLETEMVNGL